MIAFVAAAVLAAVTPAPAALVPPVAPLAPRAVVAKYTAALAQLREPRVFTVDFTLEQTGTRTLEQTHRVFRSGNDERDETIAVNGNRSKTPVVRFFRNRPYRYTVAALAPRPAAYLFEYAGPHTDGKHVDYVFDLTPKSATYPAFAFTQVTIDGVTFLPQSVSFVFRQHDGRGRVTFAKAERFWMVRTATAEATVARGVTHERLSFARWRFPKTLPQSTFAPPRPLPSPPAAVPPG